MQDLKVIGVEHGALVVSSVSGDRFRVPIDEVVQSKLRQSVPEPGTGRKLSPREIQAHIRAGMSAEDVASITGGAVDYIRKFEGPVLAEREFVVESALRVPVHTAIEVESLNQGIDFGSVIRERLITLGGVDERWASWKEAGSGWIVKLSFTSGNIENDAQIDHDARWGFDPKKLTLSPLNNEAVMLSQQGATSGGLLPRLRAVSGRARFTDDREADASRFDSGAFIIDDQSIHAKNEPQVGEQAMSRFAPGQHDSAPEITASESHQTADLLEALRRRRGEREAASYDVIDESELPSEERPSAAAIRLVDVPLNGFFDRVDDDARATRPQPTLPQPTLPPMATGAPAIGARQAKAGRKGRVAMPSWDDIVFGARSDDDPA